MNFKIYEQVAHSIMESCIHTSFKTKDAISESKLLKDQEGVELAIKY